MNWLFTEISFATPAFDEAVQLRQKILRIPLGLEYRVEDIIPDYLEFHFGLYKDFFLIACLTFRPISATEVKMRQVAVDENQRNMGWGKRLVEQSEKWAIQNGIKKISLNARKEAIPFYEKLGYQTIGEEFKEIGIPHFKMYKNL